MATYELNYTNENTIIKVELSFIRKIFNIELLDDNKINNLSFTKESIYSSSRLKGSKRLLDIIKKYHNSTDIIITDGTANIGTDAINLASEFKKINAIELSEINYDALVNNISVFDLGEKIVPHHGDTNKLIDLMEQDIIYIDAPWGGKHYKESDSINLYLGDIEISEFYEINKEKAGTFIFKVPYNYNFNNFYNKVSSNIFKHSFKKGVQIKYYLIVIITK